MFQPAARMNMPVEKMRRTNSIELKIENEKKRSISFRQKWMLFLLSYMLVMAFIVRKSRVLWLNQHLSTIESLDLSNTGTSTLSTAIFLHVGYFNLWPDMLTCARNAVQGTKQHGGTDKVDIFVSVTNANPPSSSYQAGKLQSPKFDISKIEKDLQTLPFIGNILVKEFDNSGADIGPFMKMLAHEDIAYRKYDVVLKMHSKGDNVWRDHTIQSLCGSPEQVSSILNSFEANHDVDMIAPKGTIFGPRTDPSRVFSHLVQKYNMIEAPSATFDPKTQSIMNDVHNLLFPEWIKNHDDWKKIREDDMVVVAGTMFWARYSALYPRNWVDIISKLKFTKGHKENLGIEHAIERLFATEILLRKRKIAGISPPTHSLGE